MKRYAFHTKQPSSPTSTTWVFPRYSRTKRLLGLKVGRITSHRLARVKRWLSLFEKPPFCFDCSSKAIIWISKARLDASAAAFQSKSASAAEVHLGPLCPIQPYQFSCPYSRWLRSLSKARGHSGTPTHRLTAKQKSSPNRCR